MSKMTETMLFIKELNCLQREYEQCREAELIEEIGSQIKLLQEAVRLLSVQEK